MGGAGGARMSRLRIGTASRHALTLPLSGWRVLVTRPVDAAAALSDLLSAAGAEPIVAPMVATAPPADPAALAAALDRLASYDWVVFTSAAGSSARPRPVPGWPPWPAARPASPRSGRARPPR